MTRKDATKIYLLFFAMSIMAGGSYFAFAAIHFGIHGELSADIEDWGAYGSYVGGVVGGIFTPLTLFLFTYRINHNNSSQIKLLLNSGAKNSKTPSSRF